MLTQKNEDMNEWMYKGESRSLPYKSSGNKHKRTTCKNVLT
jgi:hypothetical protein